MAGRFIEGLLVGGVPAIAVAYLTEEVDPVHAARAAGTFVAGTTIGGLLGRLVSSPVAEIAGWRIGVFTVAVICGLAAMAFVKLAPAAARLHPGVEAAVPTRTATFDIGWPSTSAHPASWCSSRRGFC